MIHGCVVIVGQNHGCRTKADLESWEGYMVGSFRQTQWARVREKCWRIGCVDIKISDLLKMILW